MTPFAEHLSRPLLVETLQEIAGACHDQTALLRLKDAGPACTLPFGNHVRRSFLAALKAGASQAAQSNRPCTWDPPCALDVFLREQLRGPNGLGLPKPYTIAIERDGEDLLVALRVFGVACDWFHLAVEALTDAMRRILPWSTATKGAVKSAPDVTDRVCAASSTLDLSVPSRALVVLGSPADVTKDRLVSGASLLGKALLRVDGVARWSGVALDSDAARVLAARLKTSIETKDAFSSVAFESPNASQQTRRFKAVSGGFSVESGLDVAWPLLVLAERCHIGRGATQGLGRIEVNRIGEQQF